MKPRLKVLPFIVIISLTTFYFWFIFYYGYASNVSKTMFWTIDSNSYRAVADWFIGIKDTEYTMLRPFFYPLILLIFRAIGGIQGIWIAQFFMWLFSVYFVYLSVRELTKNKYLSLFTLFIFSTNLTFIILTVHALTEVTTTFLLAIYLLILAYKNKLNKISYWGLQVLIISLLTVTKPAYLIVLVVFLLFFLIDTFIISRERKVKIYLIVLLSLLPVFTQISIMKVRHDTYSISNAAEKALIYYYGSEVYSKVNNISLEEARSNVKDFAPKKMIVFILDHPYIAWDAYWRIFQSNVRAASNFVNFPAEQPLLHNYMKRLNNVYYITHILMTLFTLILLILTIKHKDYHALRLIIALIIPFYIIVFTSPASFWQGDRYVLPILPVWIVLYIYIFYRLYKFFSPYFQRKVKS
ncbi:glycosyltransferase family 39 protein [bacterium AH-315-M05]|nr:glycosyltransferase family 39 protein [bacterium AH-315-M05]